jgi:hypothetical protein
MAASGVQIDMKEFAKVTYLRAGLVTDRTVNLVPLWEGGEWRMWIPGPDGLFLMKPREYAEGLYAARESARPDDIYFPFSEFVWKHATWPDLCHWITSINDDLQNLAAALAKIDFLWDMRERVAQTFSLGRFVKNEVEYILTVCRSVLDELHEIVAALWSRVTLLDVEAQKGKRPLDKKLSRMILREGKLMSADEIVEHRNVPLGLANLYAGAGPFLATVRQLRDRVIHGGHDAPFVFVVPRGFAIGRKEPLFAKLPLDKPEYAYNENLVSLRPLLAHLVMTTIYICNGFGAALPKVIGFPPDLAPDHHIFARTVHGAALARTQAVLNGGAVWWADEPVTAPVTTRAERMPEMNGANDQCEAHAESTESRGGT